MIKKGYLLRMGILQNQPSEREIKRRKEWANYISRLKTEIRQHFCASKYPTFVAFTLQELLECVKLIPRSTIRTSLTKQVRRYIDANAPLEEEEEDDFWESELVYI
jgi:hypothetical protein